MQFLKIRIEGDFWDTFVYMGKLYLWTYEKQLIICNWNKIIEDYIYYQTIFVIEYEDLIERYLLNILDTPFNELSADIQITNRKIYGTTNSGIYFTKIQGNLSEKEKIWDNSAFSLNISGRGQLSISAGSDGLFEYDEKYNEFLGLRYIEKNIAQVSESHSSNAIYSNYNIYNNSEIGSSELESFKISANFRRKFYKRFSEEEIFGEINNKPSWIHKNQIYRIINGNEIEVKSINNIKNNNFNNVEIMRFQEWKGNILSGLSTNFGIIFECDNALVVSFADKTFINIQNIDDEITKWRIFPNSKAYINDLHIVFDDYIDIYRFN